MIYNTEMETIKLEKLRKLQGERLVKQVEKLYKKVPFYRISLDKKGINPKDIKGIEDIHKLPFTKKNDLRDNYPYDLISVPMTDIVRIHASSGTTGKPTVVAYNRRDLDIFDEVVARSLVCAGAKPGMRLHNAYGYGLFTGGLGIHGGATKLGLGVIPVSGGMTDRQLMILQDFEPDVICCTPSYAQTLSDECHKRGINTEKLKVKYAVLGAEPWTESIRSHVEQELNVTATNIYGLSEIIGPGVSQEDYEEKGTGSYIWEDHFFPEIVHKETGEPLPYGEEGVLIFTTLTKEAMPLLRYWTNDICSIQYNTGGKRSHIKMSSIKGRADDMLIIRGVNLFPTQVEEVLNEFVDFSPTYQLIVERTGALDSVMVKIEKSKSFESDLKILSIRTRQEVLTNLKKHLTKKIKDNIGLKMEVIIVDTDSIPRSQGGKLNRVVDMRKIQT
jgi:phenylacetate-CoA ligase